MTRGSPGSDRIAHLDGIRALAIAGVVAVHWGFNYNSPFRGGYIGVDLFFVLSGYVISRGLWRNRDSFTYGRFLIGRVRRLYPALIGVVLVAGSLVAVATATSVGRAALGGGLALTQVNTFVVPTGLVSPSPSGLTWSLSAEWVSYLLLPLVLKRARRLSANRLAALLLLGGAVLYAGAMLVGPSWFYYGPIARSAQIAIGAAIAVASEGHVWGRRASTAARIAAPLAVIGVVVWVVLGPEELSPLYRFIGLPGVTATAAALIIAGLAAPHTVVPQWLGAGPLAALGRGSYSLYLWHAIPLSLGGVLTAWMTPQVFMTSSFVFIAVMSAGSYYLLERGVVRRRPLIARVAVAPARGVAAQRS